MCIRDRRNRARAARAAINADLGFGLEGGVHPDPIGLVLQGWAVVTAGHGREGTAASIAATWDGPAAANRHVRGKT